MRAKGRMLECFSEVKIRRIAEVDGEMEVGWRQEQYRGIPTVQRCWERWEGRCPRDLRGSPSQSMRMTMAETLNCGA